MKGMHARSNWKQRLGPTCIACTMPALTKPLISTIVGLTISCSPTPGRIYRAKKGFGVSVPEEVSSPVKNVTKTSRKKMLFTNGTKMVATIRAAISQAVSFLNDFAAHAMSLRLFTTGTNMERAAAFLALPSTQRSDDDDEDTFNIRNNNSSSSIFFISPDSIGASAI